MKVIELKTEESYFSLSIFEDWPSFLMVVALIGLAVITILMCLQESRKRKINFWLALAICFLVSPILGYFILTNRPLRNARGCKWCNNHENEVEFCGVCGKNEEGEFTRSAIETA